MPGPQDRSGGRRADLPQRRRRPLHHAAAAGRRAADQVAEQPVTRRDRWTAGVVAFVVGVVVAVQGRINGEVGDAHGQWACSPPRSTSAWGSLILVVVVGAPPRHPGRPPSPAVPGRAPAAVVDAHRWRRGCDLRHRPEHHRGRPRGGALHRGHGCRLRPGPAWLVDKVRARARRAGGRHRVADGGGCPRRRRGVGRFGRTRDADGVGARSRSCCWRSRPVRPARSRWGQRPGVGRHRSAPGGDLGELHRRARGAAGDPRGAGGASTRRAVGTLEPARWTSRGCWSAVPWGCSSSPGRRGRSARSASCCCRWSCWPGTLVGAVVVDLVVPTEGATVNGYLLAGIALTFASVGLAVVRRRRNRARDRL